MGNISCTSPKQSGVTKAINSSHLNVSWSPSKRALSRTCLFRPRWRQPSTIFWFGKCGRSSPTGAHSELKWVIDTIMTFAAYSKLCLGLVAMGLRSHFLISKYKAGSHLGWVLELVLAGLRNPQQNPPRLSSEPLLSRISVCKKRCFR